MSSRQQSTRVPLADKVYEQLLSELINGERPPGQRLNIDALSRELNISQTPLREALARLEHTGFVERVRLKGYTVSALLTPSELIKLMDTRLLLEPALVVAATEHATTDFLELLKETIDMMYAASGRADEENLRKHWQADELFHSAISRQADNSFMDRAYQSLGGQSQRFRILSRSGVSHASTAADDHKLIYEAIVAGAGQAAAEKMRFHIENARNRALIDQPLAVQAEPNTAQQASM